MINIRGGAERIDQKMAMATTATMKSTAAIATLRLKPNSSVKVDNTRESILSWTLSGACPAFFGSLEFINIGN